jgi:hypothetical protein
MGEDLTTRKRDRYLTIFVFALITSGCAVAPTRNPAPARLDEPFHFGELKPNEISRKAFEEATVDFKLVIAGKLPRFAVEDVAAGLPADGGTVIFKGNGYKLTVLQRIAQAGGVDGYLFGPVIDFDESHLQTSGYQISHLEFYTTENLISLRGKL